MPIVIDPETQREVEVSEQTFRALRLQVENDRRVSVTFRSDGLDGPEQKQRLWDAVEGAWTKGVPVSTAQMMLREVVFKCGACAYTSVYEGHVASHTRQVREQIAMHGRARLRPFVIGGREPAVQCTGCGQAFAMRKDQGRRHIDRVHTDAETHLGAIEEVVMHRYSFREGLAQVLGTRPAAEAMQKKRKVAVHV